MTRLLQREILLPWRSLSGQRSPPQSKNDLQGREAVSSRVGDAIHEDTALRGSVAEL